MSPLGPVHIAAGLVAIVAGYIALFAGKGASVHRRSGTIFVYAMLVMASTALVVSLAHVRLINIGMSVLTIYMVITALLTVRERPRSWDTAAIVPGVVATLYLWSLGVIAAGSPDGEIEGMPAAGPFLFGLFGFVGVAGDVRLLGGRIPHGAERLRRHLWRMCMAATVATGSFFLGQPQVFPEPIRGSGIRPLLGLLPLAVMVYWLVRTRIRRRRASLATA
jgi:hypothetical protein